MLDELTVFAVHFYLALYLCMIGRPSLAIESL